MISNVELGTVVAAFVLIWIEELAKLIEIVSVLREFCLRVGGVSVLREFCLRGGGVRHEFVCRADVFHGVPVKGGGVLGEAGFFSRGGLVCASFFSNPRLFRFESRILMNAPF